MNHQPTFPDEAVEALAKRIARRRPGRNDWSHADVRHDCKRIARRDLDALTPFLVQGRGGADLRGLLEWVEGQAKGARTVSSWLTPVGAYEEVAEHVRELLNEQPHPASLSEQDREKTLAEERSRLKEAVEKLPRYGPVTAAGWWKIDLAGVVRLLEDEPDLAERGEGR